MIAVRGRPAPPRGPCLVAGLGRAGEAALGALSARWGADGLVAWDAAETPKVCEAARRWRRRGVEVALGGDGLAALEALPPGSAIVKSPGIELEAPVLLRGRERGAPVIDELELGWRLTRRPIAAVTGTNGKSTTSGLLRAVLDRDGAAAEPAGNVERGAPLSAVGAGEGWIACEVSSFQLEACGAFLPEIAVFTNLTLEHLDRHGTMESYGAAKRSMFVRGWGTAGISVVNVDDPFGRRLAGDVERAGGSAIGYGFSADAEVRIAELSWDMRSARMRALTPAGEVVLVTRLPGRHNALNAAAALAAGLAARVPVERIRAAIESAGAPPGRFELIDEGQPFELVVDYAHTPDGIRQLLSSVRAVAERRGGAVRAVFGAVGLREPEKGSASGRALGELSDQLVLTTGTAPGDARIPRLAELKRAAAGRGGEVEIVLERRAAIRHAVASAEPGDVVAVLGLGVVPRLLVDAAGTAVPFDDREAARSAVLAMKAS